jgi:hypothetical protein
MTFNGTTLTLANDASISGLTVGKGGGSVSSATALGYHALYATNTGVENTGLGYYALQANTSGYSNTGIGAFAGFSLTSGALNTFIGDNAAQNTTTGSSNTAVGTTALNNNTTASNNTAVGYQAGYSTTTGTPIVAVGYAAAYTNSTGYDIAALGYQAAYSGTTANSIVAIGTNALYANTTGSYNIAIGQAALRFNTTASYNTALGYQAGYSTTTTASNTYIGNQAGYTTTGGSNTFIGASAGYLVSSGASNTILGRYNGNQGGLDIRTASNYIVLSDGDGNPRGIFDGSGNLMVGRTSTGTSNAGGFSVFASGLVTSERNGTVITANRFGSDGTAIELRRQDATVGSISVTTSATAYNTSSDYRLKENIAPMIGALATVSALKPVTYKWKADGSDGQGFIAHELQEVVPDCVTGEKDAVETYIDEDGEEQTRIKPQGIDTSFLVATLTAAIQELKAEVDSLKQQLGK